MDQQYTIEKINDKYYIFDNYFLEFMTKPIFESKAAAQEYINDLETMCSIMCDG